MAKPKDRRSAIRGLAAALIPPGISAKSGVAGHDRPEGFSAASPPGGAGHERLHYQLEANPRYVSHADQIFAWLERPAHFG